MKRIFQILVVFLLTIQANAFNHLKSIVHLRLQDNTPFCVLLNDQKEGEFNNNVHLFINKPGIHNIKVFREVNYFGFRNMELVHEQNVKIPANREIFAVISPSCGYKIESQTVIQRELPISPVCNFPAPVVYQEPAPNSCAAVPMSMHPEDFTHLLRTLKNASFESTRFNIFKQALSHNYFNTKQVIAIMNVFSFEQTKVDVAKLAYPKTVDQPNYYLINNEFAFSGSVDQLHNYLASLN